MSWSSRAGGITSGGWATDGAAIGGIPVDPTDLGAYTVLTVSADVDPTSSEWVGVGLSSQATGPYWGAGQLWALVRSGGTFEVHAGGSQVASGSIPGSPAGGFHKFEIRYDTVTGVATVDLNQNQIYSGTVLGLDIHYAGFHMHGAAEGSTKLDNFVVTSEAP